LSAELVIDIIYLMHIITVTASRVSFPALIDSLFLAYIEQHYASGANALTNTTPVSFHLRLVIRASSSFI
jgi:hypothetical protein